MKIKLYFDIWMRLAMMDNISFYDVFNNNTNVNWGVMGLKELSIDPSNTLTKHFDVIDEKKFLLSVIEHGIVWSASERQNA